MNNSILPTCLCVLLLVQLGSGEGEGDRKFDPRKVVPAVRAITDPTISKPAAAANKAGDSDLVIGLVIGGAARAYPINMLTGPQREIINDQLGGRSIAATW
jgi:hypothetical protein